MKLYSPAQVIEADKRAVGEFSITSCILMEQAAFSAALLIRRLYPSYSISICLGPGNNGADGVALARILFTWGFKVCLYSPLKLKSRKGLLSEQLAMIEHLNIPLEHSFNPDKLTGDWLIVDALFGIGLNRPISGEYKQYIKAMNRSRFPVFSLDIPSGVNGLTGQTPGPAVKADHSLGFGPLKPGNLLYPGFLHHGELYQSILSYPAQLFDIPPALQISMPAVLPIPKDAYKGSRGYGLVIGGSASYRGAPGFAAEASMESGGGYVHLALPESLVSEVSTRFPEAVYHGLKEREGSLSIENLKQLKKLITGKNWIILGPGLGRGESLIELLSQLVPHITSPLILDGDALTLLKDKCSLLRNHPHRLILTPHVGEASALLNCSIEDIQQDPIKAVKDLFKKTGAAILLKQPHSIYTLDGEQIFLTPSGSPALATAGSGDILCGIIAAMLGRGLNLQDSLASASMIHGLAGEELEKEPTSGSIKAGAILKKLTTACRIYQEKIEELKKNCNQRVTLLE